MENWSIGKHYEQYYQMMDALREAADAVGHETPLEALEVLRDAYVAMQKARYAPGLCRALYRLTTASRWKNPAYLDEAYDAIEKYGSWIDAADGEAADARAERMRREMARKGVRIVEGENV